MAKGMAKAAGLAVLALVLATTGLHAQSSGVPTFVVHVHDYERLDAEGFAKSQAEVSAVYANVGVHIEWATGGAAATAPRDGLKHVDLLILTRQMTDRTAPASTVLGRGSHLTKRAYIFHPRVIEQSRKTGSRYESVLAYVIAHELGHVLLPEYSHAPSGLMRADWEGEHMLRVPNFAAGQALEFRLIAASAH